MSKYKIQLTEQDFKNLVSGKQITIDVGQIHKFNIDIILADIGFDAMNKNILEAQYQNAKDFLKFHTRLLNEGGNNG
jgi:hypothetical protein